MLELAKNYLVGYLIAINIFSFLQMAWDKWQAKKGGWRIKENSLFLIAFLGGALGGFMAMKVFRHKTKHNSFKYGLPLLIMFNVVFIYFIYKG